MGMDDEEETCQTNSMLEKMQAKNTVSGRTTKDDDCQSVIVPQNRILRCG